MRRGDICLVDFEPVVGAEANKRRPAVVVSNDALNATVVRLGRGVVTVAPISSNVGRIYPFQVPLPAAVSGLNRDSKVQAEQVRAVAVQRVGKTLGSLPIGLMADLDDALRLHLGL